MKSPLVSDETILAQRETGMIRYDVKTLLVESPHFRQGVLMNEEEFNPALHKRIEATTPLQKTSDVKKPKVK